MASKINSLNYMDTSSMPLSRQDTLQSKTSNSRREIV
jgi:hypothetical protein